MPQLMPAMRLDVDPFLWKSMQKSVPDPFLITLRELNQSRDTSWNRVVLTTKFCRGGR